MKPSAVAVVVPNVGVNAAASDVAVTGAEPPTVFDLEVVIVAVELVPGATPVMVAKPVPLPVSVTTTVPDAVGVPKAGVLAAFKDVSVTWEEPFA